MKALLFLLVLIPFFGFALGSINGPESGFTGIFFGFLIDFVLIILGVRLVKQNTVQLVERFGKYNRVFDSGFNVIIPVVEWTKTQELYKKNFQVTVDGLTGDNVTVSIGLNVVFFVKNNRDDIYSSVYEIDNPNILIRATVDEQLRSMITEFTHKEIFTKREEIGNTIEQNLRLKLEQFGYTLDSIQVQDIQLEEKVLSALNKIIETEKLKEAALNEAEALRIKMVKEAEALRIKMVKEAEADKEAKKLIGEGMAEQRKAIANGFKESIDTIKNSDKNLSGTDVLNFLLDSARNAKVIYLNQNLEGNNRIQKLLSDDDKKL